MATEIDRLGVTDGYGSISLHERSDGESFFDPTVYRAYAGTKTTEGVQSSITPSRRGIIRASRLGSGG
ncbi:hypothetical protein [Micromonospora sp. NPDC049274]|uniref:hypothetical protein n=1 Tax=Micromonospora sp. NPDC049274 TaxID=3154829 RepID=UPI00344AD046